MFEHFATLGFTLFLSTDPVPRDRRACFVGKWQIAYENHFQRRQCRYVLQVTTKDNGGCLKNNFFAIACGVITIKLARFTHTLYYNILIIVYLMMQKFKKREYLRIAGSV